MTQEFAALRSLDDWVERHDYQAYDPFDGLSGWLRPLAVGKVGRQLLQQGVKRFPANLRPIMGIRPATSSKGMGYLARGYLKLFRLTGDTAYLQKTSRCLDWLLNHPSRGYSGHCWGNHFEYQSRLFHLPKDVPTVVWTAHIGFAFLDAWEVTGNARHLDTAKSICNFIKHSLERRPAGNGVCISYVPHLFSAVHNANMLAAAMLARTYSHTHEEGLRAIAAQAVAYTAGEQRMDGSWWYGEAGNLQWVDNFHTGYVLDCLWWYMHATGDHRYFASFKRGAEFFVKNFFLDDGTPKYYPHRAWPIDIQCAAQAIETLTLLAGALDHGLLSLAKKVAQWSTGNLQAPDGHFYFQKWPWGTNKTPMLHWGQATMLHALACLMLENAEDATKTPPLEAAETIAAEV
jgi:rhamnogalacturonyl hydrolase YesR